MIGRRSVAAMESSARYLVELDRPSDGWLALQGASSRARRAADALAGEGADVRFLRSIYVPEDDTCFFLLEAESAAMVDEVGRRSGVSFQRVTQPMDAPRGWQRASRPDDANVIPLLPARETAKTGFGDPVT